jgi:hypothetical protein
MTKKEITISEAGIRYRRRIRELEENLADLQIMATDRGKLLTKLIQAVELAKRSGWEPMSIVDHVVNTITKEFI